MNKIKVMIADDHSVFRSGLLSLLEKEEDIEVVALAGTGREALDIISTTSEDLDVLMLDINMPEMSGFDVAKVLHQEKNPLKVLVLTMYKNDIYAQQMLDLGVKAYMLKNSSSEEMIKAIRKVFLGEVYIDAEINISKNSPEAQEYKSKKDRYDRLTPREKEICEFLSHGFTNPQIAKKLFISDRTVESHRKNLMTKLEIKGRAELMRIITGLEPKLD